MWQHLSMEKWKREMPVGRNISKTEVKDKLTQINGKVPCRNTVDIYFEELVQDPDQPLIKKKNVYHKTERRYGTACA